MFVESTLSTTEASQVIISSIALPASLALALTWQLPTFSIFPYRSTYFTGIQKLHLRGGPTTALACSINRLIINYLNLANSYSTMYKAREIRGSTEAGGTKIKRYQLLGKSTFTSHSSCRTNSAVKEHQNNKVYRVQGTDKFRHNNIMDICTIV